MKAGLTSQKVAKKGDLRQPHNCVNAIIGGSGDDYLEDGGICCISPISSKPSKKTGASQPKNPKFFCCD